MPTLTDRYVWAVVRLLPEPQRPEIDREVRSLVAEMVDTRTVGNGSDPEPDPASVERGVLVELGDPSLLAARYAQRPRALIGPEHFLEYLRVLKLVLVIVVPLVAALAALGAAADEDPTAWSVLGSGLSGAFMAGIQVAFWVTVVYAFADRWKADDPWTPEALPNAPASGRQPGIADMTFGIVVTVLTAVAMVWQQAWPWLRDADGDRVPVLDPDLWSGPGQVLIGLLGVSLVIQIIVLVRRGWSRQLAIANLVTNAGFLGVVAWAALDERLVNTRLLEVVAERGDLDQVPTVSPWIPIVLVAAVEVWDSAEAFLALRRGRATVT